VTFNALTFVGVEGGTAMSCVERERTGEGRRGRGGQEGVGGGGRQ